MPDLGDLVGPAHLGHRAGRGSCARPQVQVRVDPAFPPKARPRQRVVPVVSDIAGVGAIVTTVIPTLVSVDWSCISVWPRWARRWSSAWMSIIPCPPLVGAFAATFIALAGIGAPGAAAARAVAPGIGSAGICECRIIDLELPVPSAGALAWLTGMPAVRRRCRSLRLPAS